MAFRTDLAIEKENGENAFEKEEETKENIKLTRLLNKEKKEKYITIEFPSLELISDYEEIEKKITNELKKAFDKECEKILVVGLGNTEITPDSIGPKTAQKILATRHIAGAFAEQIGLKGIKSVAVISPNVLGKTGIETAELIKGVVDKIKPDGVIAIDALASLSVNRLFRSVQISNNGISPGSGVKNSRREISEKTLNIPVVAIGVPTVVEASNLAFELTGKEITEQTDMIVTPKDADLLSHRISEILARSINVFLQPEIDKEVLFSLV